MGTKKIYVLQIGMTPNPGGIEAYVMNLYKKIDRHKVQFDFVDWCGNEDIAFGAEIRRLGGHIFKIPSRQDNYLENKRAVNKLVASGKYSYTYNNLNSLSNITGITSTYGIANVTPIIHAHNDNIEEGKMIAKFLDKVHKPYVNFRKGVRLACSRNAGKWMFPHKEFSVVADSIDTLAFKYTDKTRKLYRHELGLENKLVVGSVARFGPQKNLPFLIKVFQQLCETVENAILLLVGAGEQEEQLRKQVIETGLNSRVHFLGARTDTANLMQAMDLLIAPSIFEGFGMSVLEAQCAGLPCYVSEAFHPEVLQTSLVKKISLELSPACWSDCIRNDLQVRATQKRLAFDAVIKEKGYDSRESAARLQDKLLSGFREKGNYRGESYQ